MIIFLSCKGNSDRRNTTAIELNFKQEIDFNWGNIKIERIIYCVYPKNDPVYIYHKNKKLILIEVELKCCDEKIDKKSISPAGNLLLGSKGDTFCSSAGVIAMAQNNKCIPGDDIEGYNQIWNGTLDKTAKAFALGFEVPENFIPDKLFWNNECKLSNRYFSLLQN